MVLRIDKERFLISGCWNYNNFHFKILDDDHQLYSKPSIGLWYSKGCQTSSDMKFI